jgi:hypothetical protein
MKEVTTNPFSLFESEKGYEEASKELTALVDLFAVKYTIIKKKYPHVGIGDTSSDEALVDVLYTKIHG